MTNADYLRTLRAAAVAAGMCQQCRCRPQKPGRVTCQHCLDKAKQRDDAYRFVGLCECGREPEDDKHAACSRCRAVARTSQRDLFARKHRDGICEMCTLPAAAGRRKCVEHLKRSVRATARAQSRYLSAGRCRCGREPKPGCVSCQRCIDRNTAISASWSKRHRASGLCTQCSAAAAPGRSKCQPHIDRHNARQRERWARYRAAKQRTATP